MNKSGRWTIRHEHVAELMAEGLLSDAEIAAAVKGTLRLVGRWRKDPRMEKRVDELIDAARVECLSRAIAQKAHRIDVLQDIERRLVEVLAASGPNAIDAPTALRELREVLEQAAREVGDRRSGGDTEMTLHHDAAPSGYTYDEWRQLPLAERIRLCGPTGGAPLALPAGPGAAHEGSVDVLG